MKFPFAKPIPIVLLVSLTLEFACIPRPVRPGFKWNESGGGASSDASDAYVDQSGSTSEETDTNSETPVTPSSGSETPGSASGHSTSTSGSGSNTSSTNGSGTSTPASGNKPNEASTPKPMPVPPSRKLVYRPLGLTKGGYRSIKDAAFPDKCEKGDLVPTTGALFPFNQSQTLVVRGPLVMSHLVVYKRNGDKWSRLSDLSNLSWIENEFGSKKSRGSFLSNEKMLENGRELFTHLPEAGEKIIITRVKMPMASGPAFNTNAQNDVPAVWMLNTRIFEEPSSQYFCNCRGLGNPGGCGELDIAEIIPENKTAVTSTLYSYEGARGGILTSPRPTKDFQIYAAILRVDGSIGEASVLEVESFDFGAGELSDSFVSKEWLPAAKALNKGGEALIPPKD